MLNCKKIETAIRRAQKKLMQEASKNGVYENFGQTEVRAISDKFIDLSDYSEDMNNKRNSIKSFSLWASTYTNL